MSTDVTQFAVPEGPGSVTSAPNLPAGFTETFSSRIIDTGGHRQHIVVGGDGPPLLLVHGWPESWYAWRLVMPTLAEHFTVVAVDQRGMGLTDKPDTGYDSGSLAADLIRLMDALGFDRFAVAGHDTGMVISYAVAADNPDRVAYLIAAEIPVHPVLSQRHPCSSPGHSTTSCGTSPSTGPARSPSSWSAAARTSSSATSSQSKAATLLLRTSSPTTSRLHDPGVAARRPRVLPRLGRHDGPERRAGEADAADAGPRARRGRQLGRPRRGRDAGDRGRRDQRRRLRCRSLGRGTGARGALAAAGRVPGAVPAA